MPRKPKRPCSYPGCPNLTDGRFCPEHEKNEAKRYEKYDRDPNTAMLLPILFVRCALRTVSTHQPSRYTM